MFHSIATFVIVYSCSKCFVHTVDMTVQGHKTISARMGGKFCHSGKGRIRKGGEMKGIET